MLYIAAANFLGKLFTIAARVVYALYRKQDY